MFELRPPLSQIVAYVNCTVGSHRIETRFMTSAKGEAVLLGIEYRELRTIKVF